MAAHTPERPPQVLVVEDELLLALDIVQLLRKLGCEAVGPAPSVSRAQELIDEARPDFALLDVNLGGERSTAVAETLRALDVPYALATGYGAEQLPEPALRDAPRVTKPLTLDALRALLDAHLHGG